MRAFTSKGEIEIFAKEHAQGDFGCLLIEISEQAQITIRIRVTIDARLDIGRIIDL